MGQYATKHGHAGGKLTSMLGHPDVEVAGVYEPDDARWEEVAHTEPYTRVRRLTKDELLRDPSIVAVAAEGLNSQALAHTEEIVAAGKHVWYDKPAGDNWEHYRRVMALVAERGVYLQMGYMFRYHHGFRQLAEWANDGLLGDIFSVRAHMSTNLSEEQREVISEHVGGIFFDLAGHMLDQVVYLLGRPDKVTSFLHNHQGVVPAFKDNTLAVFEFEKAIAFVDIAAMEPRPMARTFEVYGTQGSAIIVEPFEPAHHLRLCLAEAAGGYAKGVTLIEVPYQTRQAMYDLEIAAFVRVLKGEQARDRTVEHEILVQETLLRAASGLAA
jgi:predicted dehydrogenase